MGLDLKPGDEVITPSFTYIATTEVIALLKLTRYLLKLIHRHSVLIRLPFELLLKDKGDRTCTFIRSVCPMEEIMDIAREFNLYVIEDNAQAIGCDYIFKME